MTRTVLYRAKSLWIANSQVPVLQPHKKVYRDEGSTEIRHGVVICANMSKGQ